MPEDRKATRRHSVPQDLGKQSHRIKKHSPRLFVRKSARLQERRDRFLLHMPAAAGTKRIRPLPSPSASVTRSEEISQFYPRVGKSEEGKQEENWAQDFGQRHIESKRATGQELCQKRKQTHDIEDLAAADEPAGKRRRLLQSGYKESTIVLEDKNCRPVEFWAKHQVWPPKFAEMDTIMSEQITRKRSISSYTQGVREGQNPRSWSLAHEREMVNYNMIMDIFQIQTTISDNSKQLCADLLSARYELPKDSLFEDDIFMAVFRGARARNEARVNRDITPLIVPSAELLHIRNVTKLEHIIEEIGTEWTQCSVIFGPRPKSDYVAGLASSAFTPDELSKLKLNHTADCPSYVTDCLYFPFLICEVKSAARTVAEAERQAMHSGSIAARAIIRLYEKASRAKELNREILVLSISHDPSAVRLHGHYALIEDEKTTFFRHLIYSFDFTIFDGRDRWTAYHFTRKVYDDFYHKHLERIRSALAEPDRRSSIPFTSNLSFDIGDEGPGSQELVTSAPSSQDVGGFKVPTLPSTVRAQQENERLNEQFDRLLKQQQAQQQMQQQEQQRQQQEQQRMQQENERLSDQLDKLLKQQQVQQQMQQQEQQRMQQENDRLKDQIDMLLRQHQEQQRQQQEQKKEQVEQYKEVIKMLKQQIPGNG